MNSETMMPKDMTFSIAIAAYNRGPAIARTLDSVLAQTVPASEVIVVDDGSTDDTASFVRTNYPQVRLVVIPHAGQSVARNSGVKEAKSEFVIHFDSDDEMLPHAVESFQELARTFPEAPALFTDHRYVNEITGVTLEDHHASLPEFKRLENIPAIRRVGDSRLFGRELYYSMLYGGLLQQPWAVRRDFFLKTGGFVPGLRSNEDWDLFLRITYDNPVVLSDRVLSTYYVEKGRDHVHRSEGQDEANMTVIRRRLAFHGFSDLRAATILRKRLGNYLKTAGDRLAPTDRRAAWKKYRESFSVWPFDHVVGARICFWGAKLFFGEGRQRTSEVESRTTSGVGS